MMRTRPLPTAMLLVSLVFAGLACHAEPPAPEAGTNTPLRVVSVKTFVLPRMGLDAFGDPAITPALLEKAVRAGLKYKDLPSIGSGLARIGDNEFVGITDRGPNGAADTGDDATGHRVFPLPQFCPSIARFTLQDGAIRIAEVIPMHDSAGKHLTGLSTTEGEELMYESPEAKSPLPFDPNGVDPEGIRRLPDGNFILVEEYSPSIFIVSPKGEVLVRYTPVSKPLTGATYPVKPILPDVLTQRRPNHGFENIALSADGHFAYAIVQAPLGDAKSKKYENSRVVRVLKLDVSKPLQAKVAGEYLLVTQPAAAYSATQKQGKINLSDAECIGPDKLLVIERGKKVVKLIVQDLHEATNILGHKQAGKLTFEDVATDLASLGIRPAASTEVFSTVGIPEIDSDKIEGLTLVAPDEIAISNDNDFGIGDNTTGAPSKVWLIKFNRPL